MSYKNPVNLYTDEHLKIDHFINGNKTVVITFSEAPNSELNGLGYAGDFFSSLPVDLVAVKSAKGNYFQDIDHEKIRLIFSNKLLSYDRRVSYGSSMGGFGAFVFAKDLAIDTVICISARAPEDAQLIKKDTSINFSVNTEINENTLFLCVFDPYVRRDKIFYNKISRLISPSKLIALPLPFSGHPATYIMHECNVLKDFSKMAVLSDVAGVCDLLSKRRQWRTSKTYFYQLSNACLNRKKFKISLSLIDKALKIDSNSVKCLLLKGKILLHLNCIDDSIDIIETAISISPKNHYLKYVLSDLLTRKGLFDKAIILIDQAISINPKMAIYHRQKNRVLEKMEFIPPF